VSYSNEVAPILALNCHACHGGNPESAAGGFSTRTWADLNRGGNLGPVIVPGDPGRSPLYQFVSGARGEPHRMPLGGPPLAAEQVAAIGKWIVEGAREDTDASKKYRLDLPAVRLDRSTPVRISARIPSASYVELELTDSGGRTLYREGGAVKATPDPATIGVTGEWLTFDLRRGSNWPERVRVRLSLSHAEAEPAGAVVVVAGELTSKPTIPDGEAELRILSSLDYTVKLEGREQLSGVLEIPERLRSRLAPGLYVVRVHYTQTRVQAAILLRWE
jgi:hypothetical protein